MKRLRHPIRAIREPFGTAGLVIACIALIAALGGTAFAAKGALTGKQKKEVEKIAKKYAGKPGAPGAAGANGKDGSNGTNGKDGVAGSPGSPGAPGKSVKVTAVAAGEEGALEECNEQGGSEVEVEGSGGPEVEICNGKKGDPGPEGQPWTPNSILPAGASETGTWYFQADSGTAYAPISFPIELPGKLKWAGPDSSENKVHFEAESNFGDFDEAGGETLGCTGSFQLPVAPPGHLCVYVSEGLSEAAFEGAETPGRNPVGVLRAGGLLAFEVLAADGHGGGTFAVKAPCGDDEVIVEVPEDPDAGTLTEFICEKAA
ncbi:MAG TPA: hypothetical protein VLK37_09320 [Solirubrobacterales bacterium]|nr:hypothetical protein [Solirubrobacterales bacterium]